MAIIHTTPFSQRDKRWGENYLGFSRLKIKDYGCTITSLAMFLNSQGYSETPATVNDKLKKVNGFQGALVIWSAIPKVWKNIRFIKRARNYNNIEVAWYVYVKRLPVMVEVYAPSIGAVRHWVLYVGDRYMLDPWTGTGKPTSTYQATGYTLLDRI
jgi:hypothetical protein